MPKEEYWQPVHSYYTYQMPLWFKSQVFLENHKYPKCLLKTKMHSFWPTNYIFVFSCKGKENFTFFLLDDSQTTCFNLIHRQVNLSCIVTYPSMSVLVVSGSFTGEVCSHESLSIGVTDMVYFLHTNVVRCLPLALLLGLCLWQ